MADFCNRCTDNRSGDCVGDFVNLSTAADTEAGLFPVVLCEGCGAWRGEFQPDLDNLVVREFLDKLGKASATSNQPCVLYQYLTDEDGAVNTYQYSTVLFTIKLANEVDETIILKFVSAAPPARVS
jgi:hypothetical protein